MRHFTLQYRILVHLAHYKSISMIITHDTSDCHADRVGTLVIMRLFVAYSLAKNLAYSKITNYSHLLSNWPS